MCAPAHRTSRVSRRNGARGRGGLQIARTHGLENHMSQKTVQLVLGRLLTDEELRSHFVDRPLDTLLDLKEQGFELTRDEINAIVESDPQIWPSMATRIHPRLQRCSLRVASKQPS